MVQSMNGHSINWQVVGEETIMRVRDLLRLDTRNPPGNERRAADYLHALFEAEGIPGEIVGTSEDRSTFIARLKGDGSAPPLLLMSHTDVVAVEPEKWTHDPFSYKCPVMIKSNMRTTIRMITPKPTLTTILIL